jgi:hypothetical protein
MPATPITVTTRYTPPGRRKYNWLTAVSGYPAAPTRAEINAGSDLSAELAEVNGFELTGDSADAPDLGGGFVAQVPARVTASDSEFVFYASSNSNDIRTVLPLGSAGFGLILPEGDVPTQKCEVWRRRSSRCSWTGRWRTRAGSTCSCPSRGCRSRT